MKSEIRAKHHLDQAFYFYEDTDELDKALVECDGAIELDPYLAEAHNLRGILLEEIGRHTEAIRAYEKAIVVDPGLAVAKDNLSELNSELALHGRPDPMEPIDSDMSYNYSRHSVQAVVEKLVEIENPKKSIWKNLLYLAISILLFVSLGLLVNPVINLAILIGVLVIHETGHYTAMTLFGYRDVKVFFIPLFGAAVSGRAQNISATKKAIVSLAGPLPGIFLGFVLGISSILFDSLLLSQVALMLVFINGFNLLPVFPFDGGRFLFDVVFSRNRYGEAIFKFIAGGALVIGAIYLQDIFIGIIGLIVLISIGGSVKIGSIAKDLKKEHDFRPYNSLLEAPPEVIDEAITNILDEFPRVHNPKALANQTSELWNRLSATPPKLLTSVGLVILYIFSWVFTFMSILIYLILQSI